MNQGSPPTHQAQEKLTLGEVVQRAFRELGETFVAFAKAPKALWGVNVPYVLEGLVYFGILTILGKYCSENVQLSDIHAGWVYTGLTGGITLAMLFLGGMSDRIGVRRALILAFIAFTVGRGLLAISGTFDLGHGVFSPMFFVMSAGLLITLLAYGLYQPAAYAGVKRYTTPKTAAMGYSVIYGLMNLGAFFSGFVSPKVRHHFEDVFPPNGLTAVLWTYTLLCAAALLITLLILTRKTDRLAVERLAQEAAEAEAEKEGGETPSPGGGFTPAAPDQPLAPGRLALPHRGLRAARAADPRRSGRRLAQPAPRLLDHSPPLAVAGKCRFRGGGRDRIPPRAAGPPFPRRPLHVLHLHPDPRPDPLRPQLADPALLPGPGFPRLDGQRLLRVLLEHQPDLDLRPAPIVAGLTSRANVYTMMIAGTLVMAAPTFLLALGPMVFPFLLYVLLMSIGEAMWQPRFLQWIAEIAPPDKTGLYMGIGQFPWFLTKFGTGLYSGYFVEKFIPRPETGLPMNTGLMWLIYAGIAMISPVALILARNWMAKGMREKHGA
ncbi:MAG: MFS transporter [Acidobacteriota bacterium]|nr:MFS transporter [Acidobacteriota bacterium]